MVAKMFTHQLRSIAVLYSVLTVACFVEMHGVAFASEVNRNCILGACVSCAC